MAIPGREYSLMDIIKIDFAKLLDTTFWQMVDSPGVKSVDKLWELFKENLEKAIGVVAEGIDIQYRHMYKVFPELFLDFFCYGPLEKGLDASNGGVEFYQTGVDGASLANVADSFAAISQRVEMERRMDWTQLVNHLRTNWEGPDGERMRLLMRNIRRFGAGRTEADEWAERIVNEFSRLVKEKPTPDGYEMVPGLFSWAKVVPFGLRLGATPDGRKAGEPLSHGPNPSPGFNAGRGGTPTQMVSAVARVQPGYGNTAPLQIDIDPSMGESEESIEKVEALIRSHFELGGTMININVLNREHLEKANREPEKYPDLIVRVTGFSAYFASLSPELRQYVVDRVIEGD